VLSRPISWTPFAASGVGNRSLLLICSATSPRLHKPHETHHDTTHTAAADPLRHKTRR
jgi:hypothetical protein